MKWFGNKDSDTKRVMDKKYADVRKAVVEIKKTAKEACVGLDINPNVVMKDIDRNLENGGCICPESAVTTAVPVVEAKADPVPSPSPIPVVEAKPVDICDTDGVKMVSVSRDKKNYDVPEILPKGTTTDDYLFKCTDHFKTDSSEDLAADPDMLRRKSDIGGILDKKYSAYTQHPKIKRLFALLDKGVAQCEYGPPYDSRRRNENYCSPPQKKKKRTQPTYRCYGFVKTALDRSGVFPYHSQNYAKDAVKHLDKKNNPKTGMTNLLDEYPTLTAAQAPPGAILVYDAPIPPNRQLTVEELAAGKQHAGHIEVKISDNKYLSDFESTIPISEYFVEGKRKLKGVYFRDEYLKEAL